MRKRLRIVSRRCQASLVHCPGPELRLLLKNEEKTMNSVDRAVGRILLALAVSSLLVSPAWAASPAAGTVSSASTQTTWTGGPKLLSVGITCGAPNNTKCDNYKLSIAPPSGSFKVEIVLTPQATDDYDLEVFDPSGALVGNSGNSVGAVEK